MAATRRLLVLASAGELTCSALGTALAIRQRLPAEFGGFLRGDDVPRDFVTWKGTALSAPLPLLLAQITCIALAPRAGRAGRVGVVGLTLLGAAQFLGQLGEPIVYRSLRPAAFAPVRAVAIAGNLTCSSVVSVLGLRTWREDRRAQQPTA